MNRLLRWYRLRGTQTYVLVVRCHPCVAVWVSVR